MVEVVATVAATAIGKNPMRGPGRSRGRAPRLPPSFLGVVYYTASVLRSVDKGRTDWLTIRENSTT